MEKTFSRKDFFKLWGSKTQSDMEIRLLPSKRQLFRNADGKETEQFIEINGKGQNVFFGVCPRQGGGKAENVKEVICLWCDMDLKDYPGGWDEIRHRLSLFSIRPTVVINSGGGLHLYWFFESVVEPSDRIVAILKGIAHELHADTNVCDIARVLRVPGTLNYKYDPPREIKIETFTDDEYSLDDFNEYEIDIPETSKPKGKFTPEDINKKCEFLRYCYQNKDLSEPLWYGMVSNLSRLVGGPTLCHEYSRGYPKYSSKEVDEKILHAQDSSGPHTCQWIRENGFECKQSCGATSPVVNIQKQERIEETDVEETEDLLILPEISFPFHVFPKSFQTFVFNVADALQVEPEIVASVALTIFSGAVGNTIWISPKIEYEVSLFIWLILIAATGYGKSPLLNKLTRYIKHKQAETHQKYKAAMQDYEEMIRKSKKPDSNIIIGDKPKPQHFLVEDHTIEALADVFENDPRGVLAHLDEIGSLFAGINQYKGGKGNDEQHYLSLFNCDSLKIDRRRETRFITNTGAAIVGGIQKHIVPEILGEGYFKNGFVARFLLINANSGPVKFSRKGVSDQDLGYWEKILERAYNLPLSFYENGFIKPNKLLLSQSSLDIWEPFYNEYAELEPFLDDRTGTFLPKLRSYYSLKFIGLLHCLEKLSAGWEIKSLVHEEVTYKGIELTRYFAGQVVKTLSLYQPEKKKFTEIHQRLIGTLYIMRDRVKDGRLQYYDIATVLNSILPKNLHVEGKRLGTLLNDLKLKRKHGDQGYFLIWEPNVLKKLFIEASLMKSSDESDESDGKFSGQKNIEVKTVKGMKILKRRTA